MHIRIGIEFGKQNGWLFPDTMEPKTAPLQIFTQSER
jgi:hypothetical protein